VSGKTKRRTREPPRRLTAAEIAEIDALMEARHEQTALACREGLDQESRERQVLLREDHAVGPWPEQPGPRTAISDGGYVYVREGGDVVLDGHPFLREVARRDGVIRCAWTGRLTVDRSQTWKQDPSWQFVMTRLEDVPANDWDRVIDKAVDDLLDSNIPLSQDTRQYIKEDRHARADPERRERNRDRALASTIASELDWLAKLLSDAGHKDAKTRAAKYLAGFWRKIVQQDRGRWRFASGRALTMWLRRHRGVTKNTPKM
jgi:hypothetical protein